MFQVRDKVRVIDDIHQGVVIQVHKSRITIRNEFGFEETFDAGELILDKSFEVGHVEIPKNPKKKSKPGKKEKLAPKEIDLHIGKLVDFMGNMSNFEMLQIQLQKVKDEMELAQIQNRKKLIFIHGHGSGKLKSELMKILKKYPVVIYDASYRKYHLGATTVEFR